MKKFTKFFLIFGLGSVQLAATQNKPVMIDDSDRAATFQYVFRNYQYRTDIRVGYNAGVLEGGYIDPGTGNIVLSGGAPGTSWRSEVTLGNATP